MLLRAAAVPGSRRVDVGIFIVIFAKERWRALSSPQRRRCMHISWCQSLGALVRECKLRVSKSSRDVSYGNLARRSSNMPARYFVGMKYLQSAFDEIAESERRGQTKTMVEPSLVGAGRPDSVVMDAGLAQI